MISSQYAAGFFDGEGCVNVSSLRGRSFIRILIVNTNKEILEMFQKRWGGDIKENKRVKANWKTAYTWRVSHKSCLDFLQDINEYVIIKKPQVEAAFMFFELQPGKGKRWDEDSLLEASIAINKIKTANKKGVTVES